jgi:alanine racemase
LTALPGLEVNLDVLWGPTIRPTRAEIDLQALVDNAIELARRAASPILAVIKADAYGHGAVDCAHALVGLPEVAGYAVSLVEEGVELRSAGIEGPILVMGPSLMEAHECLVEHRLTPLLSEERHLDRLAELGRARGEPVELHIKIDTGMGRLGISPARVPALVARIAQNDGLQVSGLATHLACADLDDPAEEACMTHRQLALFDEVLDQVGAPAEVVRHAANSAAILRFDRARYDLARPGLALYGNGGAPGDALRPVMSLKSEITQLRQIEPGGSVSYGALWTARESSLVAVVPVGYADGYPRNLSGKAEVLIGGRRCRVVGAISMDMSVVDVSHLEEVAIGDEVVLLGAQGADHISAREWAVAAPLSEYEVTCGISKRVPRVARRRDG